MVFGQETHLRLNGGDHERLYRNSEPAGNLYPRDEHPHGASRTAVERVASDGSAHTGRHRETNVANRQRIRPGTPGCVSQPASPHVSSRYSPVRVWAAG